MNRDLVVNICGTIQLLCVGALGYLALKRNDECYEAQMAYITEKRKRILAEIDNIYLKAEIDDLKDELKDCINKAQTEVEES